MGTDFVLADGFSFFGWHLGFLIHGDGIRRKTKVVLTVAEVESIVQAIEGGRLKRGFRTNQKHVEHVNAIKQAKAQTERWM